MYFSKSTGGVYDESIHGPRKIMVAALPIDGAPSASQDMVEVDNPLCKIPADAVEVSAERWAELQLAESNGMMIIGDAVGFPVAQDRPPPTVDQLREAAKVARSVAIAAIVVTTASGRVFDGDETSQGRMARAVVGMDPLDTIVWTLADNSSAMVSRDELREALRLAGAAQAALWVLP